MVELKFADGWTQEITAADERNDLLSYISDTHKSVYGYRPRWDDDWANNIPLTDLRDEAKSLEDDVVREIEYEKVRAHDRMLEANRIAIIYRKAKMSVRTFKPFANLKEMLV